jgi:hypothetical protein
MIGVKPLYERADWPMMKFTDQDRHQSVGAGEAARRGGDACVARRPVEELNRQGYAGDASVPTPPRRLPRPYGHHSRFWL